MSKDILVTCGYCKGTGKHPAYSQATYHPCPICKGEKSTWVSKETAECEILEAQINKLRGGK